MTARNVPDRRVANADMAEGVKHALIGENSAGKCNLVSDLGETVWHGQIPFSSAAPQSQERVAPGAKPKRLPLPSKTRGLRAMLARGPDEQSDAHVI